ncbi:MAG: GMC oxidoreductase [Bryobacteraceae bacterium]
MKRLHPVDVVVVGAGWSGLLMAKEIATRTALHVVVLERGPARKTSDYAANMDEVDFGIRRRMMQNIAEQTITHRHSLKDRAAPIRQYGSFTPGTGTGGTGEHWGGVSDRYLPEFFQLATRLREERGARDLPENLAVRDWGVTYDEMENCYWRAEQLIGVSGKAGNLRGKLIEGGNIFEGQRQFEYPTSPMKQTYPVAMFQKAALELGYHPYPMPAANLSEVYTNPDGITRAPCSYCAYCADYGCMIAARAQPTNVLMPVLARRKNFTLRNHAWVRRIVHRDGHAEGVMYMDQNGEETFQPADAVVVSAWTPHSTRILLLSKAGDQYDPLTGKGTLGSNLTHQVGGAGSGLALVFDRRVNGFMVSGALGVIIPDFDGARTPDPSHNILRAGTFCRGLAGSRFPIGSFGRIPPGAASRNWGSEWKKAAIEYWDRMGGSVEFRGYHLSYKQNFMDLDPTYTDKWGDPLLRMTLDWTEHEHRQQAFGGKIAAEIVRALGRVTGAKVVSYTSRREASARGSSHFRHYNATSYSTTHIQGGAIMGSSPERSVVNTWLQHWKMPNLWVVGSSAFPQNSSGNPTLSILAVTYRAADGFIERYLKKPGSIA